MSVRESERRREKERERGREREERGERAGENEKKQLDGQRGRGCLSVVVFIDFFDHGLET